MVTVIAATVLGGLVGPLLRGEIFAHAVPPTARRRRACPRCRLPLVGRWTAGWAGPMAVTGRCPQCGQRVGARPGVIEALAAAAAGVAAAAVVTGPEPTALAVLAFVVAALFGVVLGVVDARVHRLPDRLTALAFATTATVLLAATAWTGDWGRLRGALLAAAAITVFYGVLWLLPQSGMGFGDVKLAPLVGLVTGWFGLPTTALSLLVGVSLAGLTAVALLITRTISWRSHQAHGPFMLVGAAVAVLLAR